MKSFLSISLALFLIAGAPQAKASFGCEVLLCLAASNGTPTECKPILKKLYKRLAKGKGFPSCKMESGPDIGGGENNNSSLPQPERGIARYIPRHKICLDRDATGRYCRKEKVIEEHYDHSGRSCDQWFPRSKHYIAARDRQSDPLYTLRRECNAKSKKWIRVTGPGIEGEYHYY